MSIISDQPINKASEDRFGRKDFSIRIAKVISSLENKSSVVISINAPWGEGKTSVLNMIEEELNRLDNTLIIRFNPWRFPDEEFLLSNFFHALASKIEADLKTDTEKAGEKVKYFTQYLAMFRAPIIDGSGVNKVVDSIFAKADIEELKKRVNDALQDSTQRIVVFMDDIDRLDKRDIQAVFRLVKLTADFSNTAYILAFDEEKVAASLAEQFGGVEGGRSFLEKIVQVPLSVPPADPQILRRMTFEGVDAALKLAEVVLTEVEERLFVTVFDKSFLRMLSSPRAVKRYTNMLNFAIPILKGEANILDLIMIEGIRAFFPRLYSGIRDEPDILLRDSMEFQLSFNKGEGKERFEELTKAALDGLTKQEAEGALFVLQVLFPKIDNYDVRVADYYVQREERTEGRNKRVSASKYFRRYFNYGVPPNDIRDKDIEKLVANLHQVPIEQTMTELEALASENRSEILIQKLRDYEDKLSPDEAEKLALALAGKSELVPAGSPDDTVFGIGTLTNAAFLLRMLLERIIDPATRKNAAIKIAENIASLPFAYEYRRMVRKLRKEQGSDEFVSVLSDESEQELARIIAAKFAKSAVSVPIEDSHPLWKRNFYIQWRWGDLDSLRNYAKQKMDSNPAHIGKFLDALLGIGTIDHSDSYSSFDPEDDYNFLTTILEPEKIREYIRQAFPNNPQTAPPSMRWFVSMYEQKEKTEKVSVEPTNQEEDFSL